MICLALPKKFNYIIAIKKVAIDSNIVCLLSVDFVALIKKMVNQIP